MAPETRMKIEQAMKELNYIPNELARSMFKQKAGIVAMLVPDIRHPYFSSLARHIEDELYKNDCKLMLCSTGDDPEREKEYMKIPPLQYRGRCDHAYRRYDDLFPGNDPGYRNCRYARTKPS